MASSNQKQNQKQYEITDPYSGNIYIFDEYPSGHIKNINISTSGVIFTASGTFNKTDKLNIYNISWSKFYKPYSIVTVTYTYMKNNIQVAENWTYAMKLSLDNKTHRSIGTYRGYFKNGKLFGKHDLGIYMDRISNPTNAIMLLYPYEEQVQVGISTYNQQQLRIGEYQPEKQQSLLRNLRHYLKLPESTSLQSGPYYIK